MRRNGVQIFKRVTIKSCGYNHRGSVRFKRDNALSAAFCFRSYNEMPPVSLNRAAVR